MAAHLSWRWIVLIMYGDHLEASVSYEAHIHTLSCWFKSLSKPLTAPKKERINPGSVSSLSPSLSPSHTSFLFPSIALSLSLCLSVFLFPSLSLSLSLAPSLTSEALKCTPGPNRTEQPLWAREKKLESVCPDISPAPARSEGRGKDREAERGREREGERERRGR